MARFSESLLAKESVCVKMRAVAKAKKAHGKD